MEENQPPKRSSWLLKFVFWSWVNGCAGEAELDMGVAAGRSCHAAFHVNLVSLKRLISIYLRQCLAPVVSLLTNSLLSDTLKTL